MTWTPLFRHLSSGPLGASTGGKSFALTAKLQGLGEELLSELTRGIPHRFFALVDDVTGLGFIDRLDHVLQ
jgi:hypothetical protein